uniref:Uncharacterized protein n=1 Tax=Oryza sativa subsp. japonica TaxID=39947 RepID=Q656L3_ORYSJ|nr:hypothetical protein [Oryza sativa Japonica Group]
MAGPCPCRHGTPAAHGPFGAKFEIFWNFFEIFMNFLASQRLFSNLNGQIAVSVPRGAFPFDRRPPTWRFRPDGPPAKRAVPCRAVPLQ